MLLKTSFLLTHLFCNVEFDFIWFHNNQTVVRDFNSQNRNAWVSRSEEYWNYWVLINAFWIRLDLSDIDIWDIDLSDTDLDLLDKDIPSKHFVCLQDVFKTSSRHIFKTSSSRIQDVFARRLGRRKIFTLKTFWRRRQDMSWRPLQDVFKTNKCLLGWVFYKKLLDRVAYGILSNISEGWSALRKYVEHL